jgi:hypothetical protein
LIDSRSIEGARGYSGLARTGSTDLYIWKRQKQSQFLKQFLCLLSSLSKILSSLSFNIPSPEKDGTAAPPSSPAGPTGKQTKTQTFNSKSPLFYMLIPYPEFKFQENSPTTGSEEKKRRRNPSPLSPLFRYVLAVSFFFFLFLFVFLASVL